MYNGAESEHTSDINDQPVCSKMIGFPGEHESLAKAQGFAVEFFVGAPPTLQRIKSHNIVTLSGAEGSKAYALDSSSLGSSE